VARTRKKNAQIFMSNKKRELSEWRNATETSNVKTQRSIPLLVKNPRVAFWWMRFRGFTIGSRLFGENTKVRMNDLLSAIPATFQPNNDNTDIIAGEVF